MPKEPQPLDVHQQELINIVRVAHANLAIARKTKVSEMRRRMNEARSRLETELERAIEAEEIRIRVALDSEVAHHEAALDDALIAAYEHNIPIRRIALDGFGNRYDGGVQQLLRALREDGRLGNRVNYQRNTSEVNAAMETAFPQVLDVQAILAESTTLQPPLFAPIDKPLVLVEPDENGLNGVVVNAVKLTMDSRDPWFQSIEKNARANTRYRRATSCTLYLNPATNTLTALESKETGETLWDHPVARWVKDHPEAALEGYMAARLHAIPAGPSLSVEDIQEVATLAEQLGTNTDAE